ncbi:hypothetical protein [Nitrincola sp.]|uniref:hypothetical protein n=1 Tax=Nitrincola sp. TaxID=1926584 RepID=UPI003A935446
MTQSSVTKQLKNASRGTRSSKFLARSGAAFLNTHSSIAVVLQSIVLASVLFFLWFLFANASANLNLNSDNNRNTHVMGQVGERPATEMW